MKILHGAPFRILSFKGQPPPAHLAGWKDVVLVEEKTERSCSTGRQRRNTPSQHPACGSHRILLPLPANFIIIVV